MDLANNIRRRRLEMGLSQQELADSVGYKSRSAIAKIEMGENNIPVSKLLEIAEALDTKAEYLLAGNNSTSLGTKRNDSNKAKDGKMQTKTAAVILAGGKSSRNMQNVPNQFINIQNKPVIGYVLDVYQAHPLIDEIYIVCLEHWKRVVEAYCLQNGIDKLRGLIVPGNTGIKSTLHGYRALLSEGYSARDTVIFQESTRPLITQEMITQTLENCSKKGSAVIGEHANDNLQFIVNGDKAKYLERSKVISMQSPDAYKLETLSDIFNKAAKSKHAMQESCIGMLMANLGFNPNFVEGPHNNIKLVRQEDILTFSALLKQKEYL